ncbi:sugar phosphate isomerase/epimerase family protein [Desertivirga arenae]|uniref:sugar phosphate isomerase/epimerase family protein n=1 Tax=Desertivirga arenae TaxID=2810309 RepID=UPI001A97B32F|nr:sugar phosphate isomerase/epimerase family protein [Pedobacter sp. SYSU D00823]
MENSKIELLAAYFTIAGDIYPFGPTEISPFDFAHRVEAAAGAGYKGVGLVHADLISTANRIGLKEMKNILHSNGITRLEFEFLGGWFATGKERQESDQMKKELMAAAEILEATNIKIAPGLHLDESHNNISLMIDEFGSLAQEAVDHGTNIALEIMPFSNIRSLETGLGIAQGADHPNGGLLLDIWHINRGNISYAELSKVPGKYIKSIELNDADKYPISPLWQDTIYRRKLPGKGVFDQKGFITAIRNTGYEGHWGVEVLSEELRKWPLEDMAKNSFDSSIEQFEELTLLKT